MNYKLEQVLPGQVRLLFALDKEDTFEKHKIGHVRGDFGRSGNQFFSTWFPCHEELKTQRFKDELQQVVDELRSDLEFPLLKNRNAMRNVCMGNLQNRVPGGWHPDTFGFKIRTEHYWYFIKCYYGLGDYNFYINCFADTPDAEKLLAGMENELKVLYSLLGKLKIDDVELWFDDGVLHAKDEDGNSWTGEEFYRFVTEECLCFGADGKLQEGQYVPEDILNKYVLLSVANGVVPGANLNKNTEE